MVGLQIQEDDGKRFHYFLGVDPPIICCDEEKLIIQTFETEVEADTRATEVREYLNQKGSTEGLRLIAFSHFGLN